MGNQDIEDFADKVARNLLQNSKDELDVILRGFLIAEFYVNDFIETELPNGGGLTHGNIPFATKLEIIKATDAKGLLEKHIRQLKTFSDIRNRFAHRLGYELQQGDIDRLLNAMGKNSPEIKSTHSRKDVILLIVLRILAGVFTAFSRDKDLPKMSLSEQAKRMRENKF